MARRNQASPRGSPRRRPLPTRGGPLPAPRETSATRAPGLLLLSALAACAGSPPPAAGHLLRAEVTGPGRVRLEGREMTTDAFLLEIRRRVEAAEGAPDRMPRVRLSYSAAMQHSPAVLRVFEALSTQTGIRHVELH